MTIYSAIQKVRAYEKSNLPYMQTTQDRDILAAVGSEAQDSGIALQKLMLLDISSFATVNRRVARLSAQRRIEEISVAHRPARAARVRNRRDQG